MGYVIRYGKRMPMESSSLFGKYFWGNRLPIALAVVAVLIRLMLPQSAVIFRNLLIPGMPDSAAESFSEMIESIKNGTEFTDAVEIFCQEILVAAGA